MLSLTHEWHRWKQPLNISIFTFIRFLVSLWNDQPLDIQRLYLSASKVADNTMPSTSAGACSAFDCEVSVNSISQLCRSWSTFETCTKWLFSGLIELPAYVSVACWTVFYTTVSTVGIYISIQYDLICQTPQDSSQKSLQRLRRSNLLDKYGDRLEQLWVRHCETSLSKKGWSGNTAHTAGFAEGPSRLKLWLNTPRASHCSGIST